MHVRGLVVSLLAFVALMLVPAVASPAEATATVRSTETVIVLPGASSAEGIAARHLWAVQSFDNQISRVDRSDDLHSGVVEAVITSDHFQVPTTAARFDRRLAVVNSKFDTGVPPTATPFEVVTVQT